MTKTIFCKLKFIDSVRGTVSSLSKLIDNLAERNHKIKCMYKHDNKNVKNVDLIL